MKLKLLLFCAFCTFSSYLYAFSGSMLCPTPEQLNNISARANHHLTWSTGTGVSIVKFTGAVLSDYRPSSIALGYVNCKYVDSMGYPVTYALKDSNGYKVIGWAMLEDPSGKTLSWSRIAKKASDKSVPNYSAKCDSTDVHQCPFVPDAISNPEDAIVQ